MRRVNKGSRGSGLEWIRYDRIEQDRIEGETRDGRLIWGGGRFNNLINVSVGY